jgi:hypothetical protein
MSFKENGRFKKISPKELADIKKHGKLFECGLCGHKETKFKVEFEESPRCPKCFRGVLTEHISI